jgi:hypothetical protein
MKINPLSSSFVLVAALVLAVLAAPVIFLVRSPVLIVTDESFVSLYGASRSRTESIRPSLALFRRVKNVTVADDAGGDVVQFAIAEASEKPFCVLFPLRFAQAARIYREQNPEVPVILLEGRYEQDARAAAFAIGRDNDEDYFIYQTDIEADFYRAGLAAGIIDGEKNGKMAVFLESRIQKQASEAFSRALKDAEKPVQTSFFTTFAQFSNPTDVSCVVLAGIGAEFLEKNFNIPVIFFSWLDPALIPSDVILVFDDSPWVQAVPASRMAAAGVKKGQIRSKIWVLPDKNIDREALRKLKKLG